MANYDIFAQYYDKLTRNVDYSARADYIQELLKRHNHEPEITLDLACGTGNMTLELYKRGFDVYGIDSSPAMLTEAKDKCYEENADILFLCQKMQNIDLFGTIQTCICSLDSINHLNNKAEIQSTFDRVSLFMDPGGYFIFDFNTPYKHSVVLANNIFIYDTPDVYCVWKNKSSKNTLREDISLDFFCKEGNLYRKSSEHFSEITFDLSVITEMLKASGFIQIEIYDDMSFSPPNNKSERVVFCCKKGELDNGPTD